MKDIKFIQVLWDYMKMNHELKKADCIIGLGTKDTNVANIASELYLKEYANKIIFSSNACNPAMVLAGLVPMESLYHFTP